MPLIVWDSPLKTPPPCCIFLAMESRGGRIPGLLFHRPVGILPRSMDALLDIRNLEVRLALREGVVRAVNGVCLQLSPRRTLGLVGESGCGKSMAAKAILRILPPRGSIASGEIWLAPREADGSPVDLAQLPANGKAMRRIRGSDISMIFQEPMSSLSPVHTAGNQIAEAVRLHQSVTRAQAIDRAVEMLGLAGVPHPEQRVNAYPHELSGGLRQRVMIAMALCCRPRLLIADEPTTALDVTVQGQILTLIRRLQQEFSMAVLMITHDMGVVAETADEVAVMYLGRIAEHAPNAALFARPRHPYTVGLLESVPRLGQDRTKRLHAIPGHVPGPFEVIAGCPFHPRCSQRIKGVCDTGEAPKLREFEAGHHVACHLYPAKEGAA